MRHALVFGGTGQIGEPVIDRLRHAGWRVTAISRNAQRDEPGVTWLQGAFDAMPLLPAQVDAIISCGPLDAFSHWYARTPIDATRVVAFGSTSVVVKQHSVDPDERDVAQRLQLAEDRLTSAARERHAAITLLRPTLVYGAARDATLSRIARIAHRVRWFPLPRRANGLRQPVHVGDLAGAAVDCITAQAAFDRAFDLPGGETLTYREMVRRVLRVLDPPAHLLELPLPVFEWAVRIAQSRGIATGFGDAAIERMRRDLVFDATPAQEAFGYAPRPFVPKTSMFPRAG
ncbi:NAD-dependent epimerase/dehydratase family protein [Cognatilysobacter terrigena]|uniref:NAD-dependent epimerase/dehydratase family protein n=1 Tax=Cognatilysobacter terrigena TaxID=2488749 RepID=UPI00105C5D3B|nr:NAD-dependent epimerase/dehydratase family protein [Lysobacter terrigena]